MATPARKSTATLSSPPGCAWRKPAASARKPRAACWRRSARRAQIFAASLASLQTVVTPRVAQALRQPPSAALRHLIEHTLAWAGEAGNHVLTLADADYPPSLLQIPDPPLLLYVKGRLPICCRGRRWRWSAAATPPCRAVLTPNNSRTPLSQAGYTIVSGMALGIDAAAHRGALQQRRQPMAQARPSP